MKDVLKKDRFKKLIVAIGFVVVFVGSLLLMSFVFTPLKSQNIWIEYEKVPVRHFSFVLSFCFVLRNILLI